MIDSPDASPWVRIAEVAAASLGRTFRLSRVCRLHGDGAAAAWRIEDKSGQRVFAKTTLAARADDLAAERDGIEALSAASCLRVPRVLAQGVEGGYGYLLLEHIQLEPMGRDAATRLGKALATLHRRRFEHFGWHRDNLLGRSRQLNAPTLVWQSFWQGQRLAPQLEALARVRASMALRRACETILDELKTLLGEHQPQPSLLHGDLWAGNLAQDEEGRPVVFDPAVYCGDREIDLAMTSLFGGVPEELRVAYASAWPLPPGHERRRHLYNLHHALNHVVLFGRDWEPLALQLAKRALSGHRLRRDQRPM